MRTQIINISAGVAVLVLLLSACSGDATSSQTPDPGNSAEETQVSPAPEDSSSPDPLAFIEAVREAPAFGATSDEELLDAGNYLCEIPENPDFVGNEATVISDYLALAYGEGEAPSRLGLAAFTHLCPEYIAFYEDVPAGETNSASADEPDPGAFVLAIRESVPQLNEPDDRLIAFGEQLCENSDPQELRNEIVVLATIGGLGDSIASTFASAAFTHLCPANKAVYEDSLTLSAG